MYRHFLKRIIDTILAVCGVVVLCVPMAVIAIIIKIDSKGSVIFRQQRVGKSRKPFYIYKFRTMCDDAYEIGGIAKSNNDKRITKIGSFLRRTSLDELPQFFNIIMGNMAIIGPRPILDWEYNDYDKPEYRKRFEVLPGMFCTVDLDFRAAASRNMQFSMDAQYVTDMSFKKDAVIFLGIVKTVFSGKNVYTEESRQTSEEGKKDEVSNNVK